MTEKFEPGELKDDPFVRAARFNDALAEEHGVEWVVKNSGLDLDKILYLCEQRALRLTLHMEGRPMPTGAEPVPIDPLQRVAMQIFQTAILDGIMIGVNATRENNEQRD